MNVFHARAYTSPFAAAPGLSFELEYAREDNGDRLSSTPSRAQVGYEFGDVAWKPKLSYRYAFFEGDDLATAKNEGFDSLIPGFYDWGTWWQGEIAGEYFLVELQPDLAPARLHLTPNDVHRRRAHLLQVQGRPGRRPMAPG